MPRAHMTSIEQKTREAQALYRAVNGEDVTLSWVGMWNVIDFVQDCSEGMGRAEERIRQTKEFDKESHEQAMEE